jgi:hypothetical protein
MPINSILVGGVLRAGSAMKQMMGGGYRPTGHRFGGAPRRFTSRPLSVQVQRRSVDPGPWGRLIDQKHRSFVGPLRCALGQESSQI